MLHSKNRTFVRPSPNRASKPGFILFATVQIFGCPSWGKAPILRPGGELLLLDAPAVDCSSGNLVNDNQYPRQFRTTEDPFPLAKTKPPSRNGLDSLNASGSAQFSLPQFKKILERLGDKKALFIDLRQEPHGIIYEYCRTESLMHLSKPPTEEFSKLFSTPILGPDPFRNNIKFRI